jgi:hypothetical protein
MEWPFMPVPSVPVPVTGAIVLSVLLAIVVTAGRQPRAEEHAGEPLPAGLDGIVHWQDEIELEENDTVLTVYPRMRLEPGGGFLVSDAGENQIRMYAADGRLLRHFAREGNGPREFRFIQRAARLPSGGVVGLDMANKGTVFDSTGTEVVHTFRPRVGPAHDFVVLDDSTLLIAGQVRGLTPRGAEARLHVWDLRRDTLLHSFFSPVVEGEAALLAANTVGFVSAAVRGDTIAAVFSLSDTVYLFRTDGTPLRKVPMPVAGFRRITARHAVPGGRGGVVEAREWIGSFSLVADLFWTGDGDFLVQYQDRVGTESHWRLLGMGPDGTRRFEATDTPHLLDVDRATGDLYFVKPGAPTPNVWARGVLAL